MDQPKDCLYLTGSLTDDFMRMRVGETVKLTITAVVNSISINQPDSSEGDKTPVVEFEVLEASGGKKAWNDMSSQDMETEIHNVKYEDQPEPQTTIPNREDGGSIWTDIKRQEKVSRIPQRRPKPFRIG